ncbi:MAG: phosphoglycerate dehydrogenase [Deltaproteobacteria bacterium]|nr:phosphoglycerate dehydrogenase [Deltaproteobacteria bacterium]
MELKNCRVLVTATTFGKCDPSPLPVLEQSVGEVIHNPLGRPLKAKELLELVKDIDGWIAGLDEINWEVIRAANRLKVISRYGVGVDRIDIKEASRKGIVITNTPGSNSVAVAEMTICLMLALARDLINASLSTKHGEWPRLEGVGLKGKTIGIIGLGSIGKEVVKRLKCFKCEILVYDPFVNAKEIEALGAKPKPLDQLLSKSDFLTLHCVLTPDTAGMVNEDFIRKMKKGAFLINTARGELVQEEAILKALNEGYLRGVALDCFSKEPPSGDNPLLKHPKVIATPHMASHTDEAILRMSWMSFENCLKVLKGERPQFIVNPEVFGSET